MERAEYEKLLARQLDPFQPVEVTLPSGMVFHVRKLTPAEEQQAYGYMAHQDPGERKARSAIAFVRYGVVDSKGEPLNRSFAEAITFINVLPVEDFAALDQALAGVVFDDADEQVSSVEEAKNS